MRAVVFVKLEARTWAGASRCLTSKSGEVRDEDNFVGESEVCTIPFGCVLSIDLV